MTTIAREKTRTCDACSGVGIVPIETKPFTRDPYIDAKCHVCAGRGWVKISPKRSDSDRTGLDAVIAALETAGCDDGWQYVGPGWDDNEEQEYRDDPKASIAAWVAAWQNHVYL
ncbi:hypothetical protein LCGC14_1982790 [marine sediment metagenome]|uniref:Uncharacterized protein n=1 Tax=marine sediment metagenome TaxID=412755 RepID=A0A0F9FWK9_9ZZZZ